MYETKEKEESLKIKGSESNSSYTAAVLHAQQNNSVLVVSDNHHISVCNKEKSENIVVSHVDACKQLGRQF